MRSNYDKKNPIHQPTFDFVHGKSIDQIRRLRDKWCRPDRCLACKKELGFWLDRITLDWILADDVLLDE